MPRIAFKGRKKLRRALLIIEKKVRKLKKRK